MDGEGYNSNINDTTFMVNKISKPVYGGSFLDLNY